MYGKRIQCLPISCEITLMSPGDILILYTDGVYDGSDQQGREQLEAVMREHYRGPPRKSATRCWVTRRSRMTFSVKTAKRP